MSVGHSAQMTDPELVRTIRRELSRFSLDISETIVAATHGIVHLNGRVRPIRGHEHDFTEEITKVHRVLRQRPGVRDVVLEWQLPDGYNRTAKPHSR
jgi:hypothetical protein